MKINTDAFKTEGEANLVNALRNSGCIYISLVAETEDKLGGYIVSTPAELSGNKSNLKILGLAPMAVLSHYQKKGIDFALVKPGLERCKSLDYCDFVVLGHSY